MAADTDRVYLTPSGLEALKQDDRPTGHIFCTGCHTWKTRRHFLQPHPTFPPYNQVFRSYCDTCLRRRYEEHNR